MQKLLVATLVSTCLASNASAEVSVPDITSTPGAQLLEVQVTEGQIDVYSDIIYSQVISRTGVRALKMTLFIPKTNTLKPAIVFYPGGGFTSANRERFLEMRMALAKAGFVVASAEYRTVPDRFPALVQDGKSAVRYLRAHAKEFGIDAERIGVIGASAGGYLSQMVATTNGETAFDVGDNLHVSSDVQAAVTIYGISNLLNVGEGYSEAIENVHASPAVTEALLVHGPAFGQFAGQSILADRDKALAASPLGHIKNNMPPFLIMHGSRDTLVSPVQSRQLYEALKAKGNRADLVIVKGAGHSDLSWYQEPVIDYVVDWFKENLKKSSK